MRFIIAALDIVAVSALMTLTINKKLLVVHAAFQKAWLFKSFSFSFFLCKATQSYVTPHLPRPLCSRGMALEEEEGARLQGSWALGPPGLDPWGPVPIWCAEVRDCTLKSSTKILSHSGHEISRGIKLEPAGLENAWKNFLFSFLGNIFKNKIIFYVLASLKMLIPPLM